MTATTRVLLVEDAPDDAALIELQLRRSGMAVEVERVDRPADFLAALRDGSWDIVLSDHVMPHFSSARVLELLRQHEPDLPCVIVSGRIGEEAAVAAVRAGAAGFVGKDHLSQLDSAVFRALREADDRRARRLAEDALRVSEERYALAAAGSNDGLWDWDLRRDEVFWSDRWKAMLGLAPDAVTTRPGEWLDRVHPQDLVRVRSELDLHIAGDTSHFESEHRVRHEDGSWRWMLVRGLAVREDGRATRLAGSMTDITRRKETEEQIAHGSLHDTLTGLPNRLLFLDRLGYALARLGRHRAHQVAVLVIDLDRFKLINDGLGHGPGDQLLLHVTRALQDSLRPGDTLARMGGDEFAMMLDDLTDPAEASRMARHVQEAIAQPWTLGGREVFSTASIGIAFSGDEGTSAEDLLRDADTAMFRAKALGRNRHVVFDPGMHERALTLLQLETDLRRGIERGEFEVLYQPIVSLDTGAIAGFESLVRWRHPTRGLVSPAEFVPFAEETGLIVAIGRQVMGTVFGHLRRWVEVAGASPFTVSINLSGRQFGQPELIEEIHALLAAAPLDPERIHFEITETVLIENAESAADMLGRLREMKVRVSLDDFGTGYSSLSYLHRFKVDSLKIDKSFVDRMTTSGENTEIVGTIAALAANLGMEVIAEGVETAEQARQLRAMHCTNAQGYLYARPIPAAEVEKMLMAGRRWPVPELLGA